MKRSPTFSAIALAVAMLASTACMAQADSTMRRFFVPQVLPLPPSAGAAGFSQIYAGVNLISQNIYGNYRSGSPSIGYGPFVNTSQAALTVSPYCNDGASYCRIKAVVNGREVAHAGSSIGFFQVPPGATWTFSMRDFGRISLSASASGLSAVDVGMPTASTLEGATRNGQTIYVGCEQSGTNDPGTGAFVWDGNYIYYYEPLRTDTSSWSWSA